ncbi:MarR family winged helix-turn-helix transcriptional regulator [Alicycliphilus sp. T452]
MSDLLSARLHALANLSAATTTLRVERKFGLSLLEWRSLGQLGGFAPLSLKELAARAGLDKSYASRTVSSLIDRGLVASERNDADGRGVMLSLTAQGQELYERAFQDAVARNEKLLAPLRAEQRLLLIEMLSALTVSARQALHDERSAADTNELPEEPPPALKKKAGKAPAAGSSPDLIEMRYLVSRLSELLKSH